MKAEQGSSGLTKDGGKSSVIAHSYRTKGRNAVVKMDGVIAEKKNDGEGKNGGSRLNPAGRPCAKRMPATLLKDRILAQF
jgi:hypothetical protein